MGIHWYLLALGLYSVVVHGRFFLNFYNLILAFILLAYCNESTMVFGIKKTLITFVIHKIGVTYGLNEGCSSI